MLRAWDELGVVPPAGLHLRCVNTVPHGRGLGSSATAIVTGVLAAQAIHGVCHGADGEPDLAFTNDLAARLEGHPDNSSASVFGGLTLSWSEGEGHVGTVRLQPHPDLRVLVLVPGAQLSTATARSVLPTHVRHADAARNSARAALLVHALTQDPTLLLPATREWLHQEARRDSFAASMQLVDLLRERGHAAVISGAGPSVLVLSRDGEVDEAHALAPGGWTATQPGVPPTGAHVVRRSRAEAISQTRD
jgi:homoserine kinase